MAIRKDKNGKYIVDISNKFNPITGERRRYIRRNIKTKEEAIQIEIDSRLFKFNDISKNDILTIDNLFHIMQAENKKEEQKQTYLSTQEYNYSAHIKGYFMAANIKQIQFEEIEQFREYLKIKKAPNNLSNNTINKIMILLKKIFDTAVRLRYIKENPCMHLKKLKIEKKKMEFWTVSEYKKFISTIKSEDSHYKYLFMTLFFTGMRIGEALALTWDDIDFSRLEINIDKTTSIVRGQTIISEPKTKSSIRSVTINKKLAETLVEWKNSQNKLLNSYLIDVNDSIQVFQFKPKLTNKDMVHKKFKAYLKINSDLPIVRIHDFRHSHVAMLIDLSNGREEYDTIKERLGHSSITTTIDTYSHLYPNKQKTVSDPLDDLF
ncbi:hypothetical protein CKN73_09145 [Carnobacterium divergens]|uniref:tyrosine-type recombinase/integrase n=1 Tax=Carnobacterium divergens TaxID=2748 RepID=UPI0010728058|nr:site-specific integrase [Carnobacterium divergens]TFJ40467.1 hypothetical protein CKN77_09245 [Carnobacterium divergens]TFJ49087.1 hypothetical protein CKN73_09145 [Carnobacterium divergens]TFJ54351.1 hypothetical protein CKN83_09050 [Carnobacterium divergens]TFJ59877.1 hypothetical protein CKN89_09490 [Carnobacterium divergens]TFJ70521.1 hypothetical protein CKN91_09105 [Carnobacterium divergens]